MQLPDRPNFRHLRDQAKALVRSGAVATLAAAQFQIARQYGYLSWAKLKHHVDRLEAAKARIEGIVVTARVAVVSWMAWMWYQHDSLLRVFGVFAIAGGLIGWSLAYQRRIKHKLAGKDPASLILGPSPTTTPAETVLRCGGPAAMGMMLGLAAASTFIQPVSGGPLLLAWAVCFLVPLFVSIDTPERILVFRQCKWTAIALAPATSYFLSSLSQNSLTKWAGVKVTCVGVVGLVLVEIGRAGFRRKLPIERWPKWLHY